MNTTIINLKKIVLIVLLLSVCGLFSCISRLGRPAMTGVIVDINGRPVDSCLVGETYTDTNGYFSLPERRYKKFFLIEVFHLEAPPLFIHEIIKKEGYQEKTIEAFNPRGGGARKGAKWDLDTIRVAKLKKTK